MIPNESRKGNQNQTQAEQSQQQDQGLFSSNMSKISNFVGGSRSNKILPSNNP